MRIYLKNKRVITGDVKNTFGLHGMQKTKVLAEQAILVRFSVIMEMQTGTDEDIQQHQAEKGDENTLLSYGVHQTRVYPRLVRLSNANGCQKYSEWRSDGMKYSRVFI